jgi:hypothetical protein
MQQVAPPQIAVEAHLDALLTGYTADYTQNTAFPRACQGDVYVTLTPHLSPQSLMHVRTTCMSG